MSSFQPNAPKISLLPKKPKLGISTEDADMQLLVVAWVLTKTGGSLRIPRHELEKIKDGLGQIFVSADLTKDEYVIRLPRIMLGKDSKEAQEEFKQLFNATDAASRILDDLE